MFLRGVLTHCVFEPTTAQTLASFEAAGDAFAQVRSFVAAANAYGQALAQAVEVGVEAVLYYKRGCARMQAEDIDGARHDFYHAWWRLREAMPEGCCELRSFGYSRRQCLPQRGGVDPLTAPPPETTPKGERASAPPAPPSPKAMAVPFTKPVVGWGDGDGGGGGKGGAASSGGGGGEGGEDAGGSGGFALEVGSGEQLGKPFEHIARRRHDGAPHGVPHGAPPQRGGAPPGPALEVLGIDQKLIDQLIACLVFPDDSRSRKPSDLVGLRRVKRVIQEQVLNPLLDPEAYAATGVDITAMPRVLMFGPPGTGKTEITMALAWKMQRPVLIVAASIVDSEWKGVAAKLMRSVFEVCRHFGAIAFFDEIDKIIPDPCKVSHGDAALVAEFQMKINKFPDVPVFGASNEPRQLNGAVISRMQTAILVRLPDSNTVTEMILKFCRALPQGSSVTDQEAAELAGSLSSLVSGRDLCMAPGGAFPRAALKAGTMLARARRTDPFAVPPPITIEDIRSQTNLMTIKATQVEVDDAESYAAEIRGGEVGDFSEEAEMLDDGEAEMDDQQHASPVTKSNWKALRGGAKQGGGTKRSRGSKQGGGAKKGGGTEEGAPSGGGWSGESEQNSARSDRATRRGERPSSSSSSSSSSPEDDPDYHPEIVAEGGKGSGCSSDSQGEQEEEVENAHQLYEIQREIQQEALRESRGTPEARSDRLRARSARSAAEALPRADDESRDETVALQLQHELYEEDGSDDGDSSHAPSGGESDGDDPSYVPQDGESVDGDGGGSDEQQEAPLDRRDRALDEMEAKHNPDGRGNSSFNKFHDTILGAVVTVKPKEEPFYGAFTTEAEEWARSIVDVLDTPEQFIPSAERPLQVRQWHRAQLLWGEGGSGKTTFAQQLMRTVWGRCVIIAVDKNCFPRGEKARMVALIYEFARLAAPTLVVIDEFDGLAIASERSATVQPLKLALNGADGEQPPSCTWTLAISNVSPGSLDPNVIRTGRFKHPHVHVTRPTADSIETFLIGKLRASNESLVLRDTIRECAEAWAGETLAAVMVDHVGVIFGKWVQESGGQTTPITDEAFRRLARLAPRVAEVLSANGLASGGADDDDGESSVTGIAQAEFVGSDVDRDATDDDASAYSTDSFAGITNNFLSLDNWLLPNGDNGDSGSNSDDCSDDSFGLEDMPPLTDNDDVSGEAQGTGVSQLQVAAAAAVTSADFHLHCSPPCQSFSKAGKGRGKRQRIVGDNVIVVTKRPAPSSAPKRVSESNGAASKRRQTGQGQGAPVHDDEGSAAKSSKRSRSPAQGSRTSLLNLCRIAVNAADNCFAKPLVKPLRAAPFLLRRRSVRCGHLNVRGITR